METFAEASGHPALGKARLVAQLADPFEGGFRIAEDAVEDARDLLAQEALIVERGVVAQLGVGADPVELAAGHRGPFLFAAAGAQGRGEDAEVVELFVGRVGRGRDVRTQMDEGLLGLREGDAVELGEGAAQLEAGAAGEGEHPFFEDDGPLERASQGFEQHVEARQDRLPVGRERECRLIGEDGAPRGREIALEERRPLELDAQAFAAVGLEQELLVEGAESRLRSPGGAMEVSLPGPEPGILGPFGAQAKEPGERRVRLELRAGEGERLFEERLARRTGRALGLGGEAIEGGGPAFEGQQTAAQGASRARASRVEGEGAAQILDRLLVGFGRLVGEQPASLETAGAHVRRQRQGEGTIEQPARPARILAARRERDREVEGFLVVRDAGEDSFEMGQGLVALAGIGGVETGDAHPEGELGLGGHEGEPSLEHLDQGLALPQSFVELDQRVFDLRIAGRVGQRGPIAVRRLVEIAEARCDPAQADAPGTGLALAPPLREDVATEGRQRALAVGPGRALEDLGERLGDLGHGAARRADRLEERECARVVRKLPDPDASESKTELVAIRAARFVEAEQMSFEHAGHVRGTVLAVVVADEDLDRFGMARVEREGALVVADRLPGVGSARAARGIEQQASDRDPERELATGRRNARELRLRDAEPIRGALEDAHVEVLELLPDGHALGMGRRDRLELRRASGGVVELVAADLGESFPQRYALIGGDLREPVEQESMEPGPLPRRFAERLETRARHDAGRGFGDGLQELLVHVAGVVGLAEHLLEQLGPLEVVGRARDRSALPVGASREQLAESGGVVARSQGPLEERQDRVVAGISLEERREDRRCAFAVAEGIEQETTPSQVEVPRGRRLVAEPPSFALEERGELVMPTGELEQALEGPDRALRRSGQVEDPPAHGHGGLEVPDRILEQRGEPGQRLRPAILGETFAPRAQAAGLIERSAESMIGVGEGLEGLDPVGLAREGGLEALDRGLGIALIELEVGAAVQATTALGSREQGREPGEGLDLLGGQAEPGFEIDARGEQGDGIGPGIGRAHGPGMGARQVTPGREEVDRALRDLGELADVLAEVGFAFAHVEPQRVVPTSLRHPPQTGERAAIPGVARERALEGVASAVGIVEALEQQLAERIAEGTRRPGAGGAERGLERGPQGGPVLALARETDQGGERLGLGRFEDEGGLPMRLGRGGIRQLLFA